MAEPLVIRIVTRLNVGGPARHTLLLHERLPRRGYRSLLVAGTEQASEGSLRQPGTGFVRVPQLQRRPSPATDAIAFGRLRRLIAAHRPAVVHTHTAKAGALGRVAARGTVRVHTFHGHVLDGYFSRPVARAYVEVERRLARRSDALVAVSVAVRDELLDLGIGRPTQWRVIPLGLDLAPLLDSSPSRDEARRTLGLPTGVPVVGIVGRLVAIKDHDTFLQAAALVAATRPDALFVVAGDGDLRSRLEADARTVLGPRARFTGWVSDLPALYAALDVVVLTSRNEGTPVALIEAGAAARPVVATDVGGVRDVVADGRTGYVVAPRDPETAARRIAALLDDRRLADELGAEARRHVAARFGAERLVDDICALYGELLESRGLQRG